MAPAEAFPQFSRLPLEIQLFIWELCLPARVIELDQPFSELVGTSCELQGTSFLNTRAPLISRVCHESRSVAFLSGGSLYNGVLSNGQWDDSSPDVVPIWVSSNDTHDPWACAATDVLHLNWSPRYDPWYAYNNYESPLSFFLCVARRKRMRVSIMAPLVMSFNGGDRGRSVDFDSMANGHGRYLVTLCVVSLHVSSDLAQWMGLFGRLGEEQVQLVGVRQRDEFGAYRNLWAAGPSEDKKPEEFFDLAVERYESDWLPKVKNWQRRLEAEWVGHYWIKARINDFSGVEDPDDIWVARTDISTDAATDSAAQYELLFKPFWHQKEPNKEHPWVIKLLPKIPHFEPMVMFRLCKNKCFAPPTPKPRPVRGRGGSGRDGTARGDSNII